MLMLFSITKSARLLLLPCTWRVFHALASSSAAAMTIPGGASAARIPSSTATSMTAAISQDNTCTRKRLWIVRHGQAQHNPRAEVAKANGCSLEEFFRLMRLDDVLDADLTDLGKQQAREVGEQQTIKPNGGEGNDIQLVVSSTLSRALNTADLVFPHVASGPDLPPPPPRISCELFREVNGDMLNAKRRTKDELQEKFPHWNFDRVETNHDATWTKDMESFEAAAERGYKGLCWLLEHRQEENILLVSHGGVLRYMMNIHPKIRVVDGRKRRSPPSRIVDDEDDVVDDEHRFAKSRFENCEVREYELSWGEITAHQEESGTRSEANEQGKVIVLTLVDGH